MVKLPYDPIGNIMNDQHQPDETRIDESRRHRFETAWISGTPLTLAECLPEVATPEFLPTLEELVHIQLEFAWKAHAASNADRPALIEDLLEQFPDLGQREILIRLLKQEYACRLAAGDQPTPAEYSERFPALVVTGREVLPVADQTVGEAPQDATDAGTTTNEPTENTALMDQPTILPTGNVAPGTGEETLAMPAGQAAGPSIRLPGIGDTIAGFCMEKELGRGGMGIVYEAAHTQTGRRVAVKVLAPELAGNTETMERFMREAQLAAALSHARSTFVFEAGEEQGCPFIVMELMPGLTLKDLADDEGPMPVNRAVDLIFDIIDGLAAAHSAGVIHRDMKPSNCFLDTDGRLKVGDYGLSKSLIVASDLTQSGSFLGTPLYSAPEQVRGTDVDERTDLYAVGATLFTLIAGRAPFIGDSASVIAQIVSDEAPLLSSLAEDAPADLDHVIAKTLEKDPAQRFETLDQLKTALQPFASGGTNVASVGRRLAALIVDSAILNLVIGFATITWSMVVSAKILSSGGFEDLVSQSESDKIAWAVGLTLVTGFLGFLYYTMFDARSGQTVGKKLMRLRTVAMDGGRVGWKRALRRNIVFLAASLVPGVVVAVLTVNQQGSSTHILWTQLPLVVSMGLALSMRSTNGFRGLHEFASGTRVVPIPEESLAGRTSVPIVAAHQSDDIPDTLGPYTVRGALGYSGGNRVLLGRDDTLDRAIWLFCRHDDTATPSTARTEVARPTRLRWLQSGSTDATSWDAYEAVHGVPLEQALQQPRSGGWDRGRHVIRELACELVAANADATLPDTIHPDQVWLARDGRVKLLDDVLVADPDSPPDKSQTLTPETLIRQLASTYSANQVLPGHGRQFVVGLAETSSGDDQADEEAGSNDLLERVASELTRSQDKPMHINWRDRVGMIGVAIAIDVLPLVLLIHASALVITSQYSTFSDKMSVVWWAVVPPLIMAIVLGAISRGGFAFRVMNVEIQTTTGQAASRYLCAQRHLAALFVIILLVSAGTAMMVANVASMEAMAGGANMGEVGTMQWSEGGLSYGACMACVVFLPPLLFGGVVWSVLNPRRGPHDLVTRTQLVPR